MLAKEIIDKLLEISREKQLSNIKSVTLEIGSIALAHDEFAEHTEDINMENLEFGLNNLAKNTALENTEFNIKRVQADNWKIADIEVE